MAMPRPPAYAEHWRMRRQPRPKPSGMSALFEKIDADFHDYDRSAVEVAAPGAEMAAIGAVMVRLQAAHDAVTRMVNRHRPGFDVAERMAIHRFLDDVNEELAHWRERQQHWKTPRPGGGVQALQPPPESAPPLPADPDLAPAPQ